MNTYSSINNSTMANSDISNYIRATTSDNNTAAINNERTAPIFSGCLARKDGRRCGDNVVKQGLCAFHLNEDAERRKRWGGYKSQLISLIPAFDDAIKKVAQESSKMDS